uniref:Uncharacterized protein n=1 Tax=Oryza punctata TaxID=4537 RepID=A0A0E0KMD6_ORYPU
PSGGDFPAQPAGDPKGKGPRPREDGITSSLSLARVAPPHLSRATGRGRRRVSFCELLSASSGETPPLELLRRDSAFIPPPPINGLVNNLLPAPKEATVKFHGSCKSVTGHKDTILCWVVLGPSLFVLQLYKGNEFCHDIPLCRVKSCSSKNSCIFK